ncbi:hypothetical protein SNE40_020080 [Patella caerulea]|uniref:Uncharacterized protein n=1 Tax=Patella caerulea TaxID=87958 RepID=A0AAN8GDR4_PATCE
MTKKVSPFILLLIYFTLLTTNAYRFYGPYDIFQPRDVRWQRVIKSNDDGSSKPASMPKIADRDDYLRQLVRMLEDAGKK